MQVLIKLNGQSYSLKIRYIRGNFYSGVHPNRCASLIILIFSKTSGRYQNFLRQYKKLSIQFNSIQT
jgi:hypothetical protein